MSKVFRKTYKFASITSVSIAVILSVINGIYFLINESFHLWFWILEFTVIFIISFFIIQYRVENFIYKRIKKIYDDVSILEKSALGPQKITTDMETLTKEVELFARNKKLEIEALKIREGYRREFTGNVSHELKTPLFTVQGYIETLINGAANDEKLRKKYLERASKGVERLIFIVKDLDMITKLEVGDANLTLEPFNIIDCITNVFDLLEIKAEKKNISLIFDKDYTTPVMVIADRQRIQQVLTNLVVNSIKYGHQNGTTEISIENLNSDKLIVRVTDNGEGVEHNHLTRLFERFYRVDKSGSREEGGSGLGLSIVKHIIEAHEEKIYVDSKLGIGSEFSFTLQKQSE